MLKVSLALLAALLVFGLVFAFLPGAANEDRTGVTLTGVTLRLYPVRDMEAEWRFRAGAVRYDPLNNESTLTGLSRGERWVPDLRTGQPTLDTTLSAPSLRIDGNDNLQMPRADLSIVKECTTLSLRGNGKVPVVVDQSFGYTAPEARVTFPGGSASMQEVRSSFDTHDLQGVNPKTESDLDANVTCRDGRIVPLSPKS